ncbi:hypothetical protein ACTJIJ_14710 [Niabella sp. 22666]|uniref:hypothetical protein n=1 Tax=Niabella sp. 22666 TaxID=3453954 RepID=UPI003F843425
MTRLSKYLITIHTLLLLLHVRGVGQQDFVQKYRGKSFNNITLETSLKPFKKNDKKYIQAVAKEMFTQWHSLLRHADTVSVMLWTGDGSEILDYRGKMDQVLEWARYMGNPNTQHEVGAGPKELSLHERAYLYIDEPPTFTYSDLQYIIQTLKRVGKEATGKVIRVGATFDPGPEFAKSDFKYKRHREILGGNLHLSGGLTTGKGNYFVSCYSVLNGDTVSYAGYPKGIPDGTPFGTFFGRQSQHFLTDLDYDYIWFSNGFGFGTETWSSTGAIFNGKAFNTAKLPDVKEKINRFWKLFRNECPGFRIETRGTNLSAGADLARDGVDLRNLYTSNLNILPPPNSPWAAMDGDFGLELVGYMSRISSLPDDRFLFRFYTHDPWWVNSPWLDRYGREPHDIYLPMSVSRLTAGGTVNLPTHLNFLTIDNSYGDMPKQVPDEVIPHILKARYDSPTAPGPLVWIYPFETYHNWAEKYPERLQQIYFGDWFIRQAINEGLPLNTVVSDNNFIKIQKNKQTKPFSESVLISIVPDANSDLEQQLIDFIEQGGNLVVYGPADHASNRFLNILNLRNMQSLEGEFDVTYSGFQSDSILNYKKLPLRHNQLSSGGGLSTATKNTQDLYTRELLKLKQASILRIGALSRSLPQWKGGKVVYLRGTNSSNHTGGRLLTPDNPEKFSIGPAYLRYICQEFGFYYLIEKGAASIKSPVLTIARSNNGFQFSGYVPNTTVKQKFKMLQGAPLFNGLHAELDSGFAAYHLPTSWHKECRIFVEQRKGTVLAKEIFTGQKDLKKKITVSGLKNATVKVYADADTDPATVQFFNNGKKNKQPVVLRNSSQGSYYVVENISGDLTIAW